MNAKPLTLLCLLSVAAVTIEGPPTPPGFVVPKPKTLTPKYTEHKLSLGTAMAVKPLFVIPSGLVITNINVIGANVNLIWQGSDTVQIQQTSDFTNWDDVGGVTSGNSATIPKVDGPLQFYRLKKVTPTASWTARQGGPQNDSGQAVVTDAQGNIYVAGYFMGAASFGGTELISAGGYDLFIAKYSSTGVYQWSRSYGSTGNELVNTIALDGAGNIYLGGSMYFTCNFGGTNMTSAGDADAFLAKYTPSGTHIWSFRFGSNFPDVIRCISVDAAGNCAASGFFQGTMNVQGASIFSWGNGIDPLLAKFNPDSSLAWVKNFYNGGTEYGNSVAFDSLGNIVLAGYFNGFINFTGGQSGTGLLTTPGGYLAKFTGTGDHLWSKAYGSPVTRFWSMALDSSGNIGIGGDFSQSTDLGGGTITGTSWGLDMFAAKFSGANGNYVWATPILGFQATLGRPAWMSVDADNFTMTGYFQGEYSFGGQNLISNPGIQDGFYAKFQNGGSVVSTQKYGSSATAGGLSVHKSVSTGYFSGTAGVLTSMGATDVIVLSR